MNIFRLFGDLLHLGSILLLLYKMVMLKSSSGVSMRTQFLYVLVFITRYGIDLFTSFISMYNTLMKLFFLASSISIVYLMRTKYRATYDTDNDTFPLYILIVPSVIMGLIFTDDYTIFELLWTFSIFLESVAIMPQLFLLIKKGGAEAITSHYVFLLGGYRVLYILNWVFRYFSEGYSPYNAWLAGLIQTVLYADFFYMYIKKVMLEKKWELPGVNNILDRK